MKTSHEYQILATSYRLGRVTSRDFPDFDIDSSISALLSAGYLKRIARDIYRITADGRIRLQELETPPAIEVTLESHGGGELHVTGPRSIPSGRYRARLERIP